MADSAGAAIATRTPLVQDAARREISNLAVWSVTSAKPGNGVELLRDGRDDTYWQSDGTQPHLVNIQFQRKVRLHMLAIYLDYKLDESYTPNKLAVRCGSSFHDLKEIQSITLEEPSGWTMVQLRPAGRKEYLKAYLVQLAVISNHQNGRDTHIRQVKIFGPREDNVKAMLAHDIGFTTPDVLQYMAVR